MEKFKALQLFSYGEDCAREDLEGTQRDHPDLSKEQVFQLSLLSRLEKIVDHLEVMKECVQYDDGNEIALRIWDEKKQGEMVSCTAKMYAMSRVTGESRRVLYVVSSGDRLHGFYVFCPKRGLAYIPAADEGYTFGLLED